MSLTPQIFISYAREDREQVFKLCDELEKRDLKIWVDKSRIKSGDWEKRIIDAIADSSYFLICISDGAINKIENNAGFIGDELIIALENYITRADKLHPLIIVPVILELTSQNNEIIAMFQHYELHEDWEGTLDQLADLFKDKPQSEESNSQVKPARLIEALHNKVDTLYLSGQRGNREKALRLIDIIEKHEGETCRSLINKGSALHALGRFDQALFTFRKAVSVNCNFAVLWSNLGIVLEDLQRYQEAIEAYIKSLQIDPNQQNVWIRKSVTYVKLHNFEEGLKSIDKAISLKDTNANAHAQRSVILYELGRYSESIESADTALAYDSGLAEAFKWKGKSLIALGDKENGEKCLEKAGEVDPSNEDFLLRLGHNYLHEAGNPQKALDCYDEVLKLNPNHPWALPSRFVALVALGRLDEALEQHENICQSQPNNAMAWASKGMLLFVMDRLHEALEAYNTALRINPSFEFAIEGMKNVLEKMNKTIASENS